MMEKKYELVAWTRNISDAENARLVMIPSLECEVQSDLVADISDIHREEYRTKGFISTDLAIKAIRALENFSRFEILTGHFGNGIRYLFFAAQYCMWENDYNWAFLDKDKRHSPHFGDLKGEFFRLCEKALALAKKYNREDVLMEHKPDMILDIYHEAVRP